MNTKDESKTFICQKCSNKLESNDSFCIMCGTNNKSNQEEQKQLPRYNEI